MARTKIDWADETWNPVWGCTYGCSFCYARKLAQRFSKQVAQWNDVDEKALKEFKPTFLPKNFWRKLTGRVIFVNSMSDLSDWKFMWFQQVLSRIKEMPDKIFLFLTKRPNEVWQYFYVSSDIPENCWFGVSATTGKELVERVKELSEFKHEFHDNLFASFEPMLGPFKADKSLLSLKWIIFGAQTNPKKLPKAKDLLEATQWFKENDVPVFHKENLAEVGIELLKEFPF